MKSIHSIAILSLLLSVSAHSQGGEPFTVAELCSTSSNSVGPGVLLTLEGVIAQHPERARASGGPSGKFGALIYGTVAANPALPWGNGSLCISPFHPGNGRFTVSNFSITGQVEIMLDGTTNPAVFPFGPGETGCFQYLYRDTQGWNLSNALLVTMAP